MIDSQESTMETTTSTGNVLPVELTIHDHCGRETRCALRKLPAILGRDEHADVRLMEPWVSERHCEIGQIGDHFEMAFSAAIFENSFPLSRSVRARVR
jgi:pSer/pThr/pTyr-binding forkhead associated (FHA) protein